MTDMTQDAARRQLRGVMTAWIGAWLGLIGVSWRLWWTPSAFPAVPLIRGFDPPAAIDAGLASALVAVLILALLGRSERWRRRSLLIAFALGALLVILNQHRLQAWFYQAGVIVVLGVTLPPRQALVALRWLTISIYFYSAIGKFDAQFLQTVGQDFVETAAGMIGLTSKNLPDAMRVGMALVFPAVELAVAGGLAVPRLRRFASAGAIVMHASVLLLLSPLGMDHRPGVWLWNLAMGIQGVLLFWGWGAAQPADFAKQPTDPATASGHGRRFGPLRAGWIVLGLVVALPLLERTGHWDHWPSWALYSPHSSRVSMAVHASAVQRLPARVQEHLRPAGPLGWQELQLDAWSLDALGVPIYPQARFQLAVATQLRRAANLERDSRIELRGVANRWTGRRTVRELRGAAEVGRAADAFWLNAKPRTTGSTGDAS